MARVWSAGDWSCERVLSGHTDYTHEGACVWDPDGSTLVTAPVDCTARVWSASSSLDSGPLTILRMTISPRTRGRKPLP